MSKQTLRNIFILLLVSVSIFLTVRYVSYLKGNIVFLENQKQNLLQEIEKEKEAVKKEKNNVQQLNIRNSGLKANLRATRKRLDRSFVSLDAVEEKCARLGAQFSILKVENTALLEEKAKLTKENETMKMKLNSEDELKKAIKELKKQAYIEGNHGYLLKNGQPTSAAKVKIEVIPALK